MLLKCIALLSLAFGLQVAGGCDLTAYKACIQKLKSEAIGIDPEDMTALPSKETLEHNCPLLDEYEQCLKNAIAAPGYCGSEDTLNTAVEIIHNMVDFICVRHREEFIKYSDCLDDERLKPVLLKCGTDAKSKMLAGGASVICDVLDESQTCMYKATYDQCGEKAAALVSDMVASIYSVNRRQIHCISRVTTFAPHILPMFHHVTTASPASQWWQHGNGMMHGTERPNSRWRPAHGHKHQKPGTRPSCQFSTFQQCLPVAFTDLENWYNMENTICSFQTTKMCILRKMRTCTETVATNITLALLDYACGSGRDEVWKYVGCWQGVDEIKMSQCFNLGQMMTGAKSVLCDNIDGQMKCIQNVVADKCGRESGDAAGRAADAAFKPMKKKMECKTQDSSLRHHPAYLVHHKQPGHHGNLGNALQTGLSTVLVMFAVATLL